jgi:hypothetical protein
MRKRLACSWPVNWHEQNGVISVRLKPDLLEKISRCLGLR